MQKGKHIDDVELEVEDEEDDNDNLSDNTITDYNQCLFLICFLSAIQNILVKPRYR